MQLIVGFAGMAPIGLRLSKNGSQLVDMCVFVFSLINLNNDVMAAIFIGKPVALSWPQFSSDFFF